MRMGQVDVLVVDDNDLVRSALYDALSLAGYSVLAARSAAEAWALFCECPPRLVLTDNALENGGSGDASGLALARRMKESSPDTPVVMFSALPPDGADSTCDSVLRKPASLIDMVTEFARLHVSPSGPADPALRY